jgi:acyl carrier protein
MQHSTVQDVTVIVREDIPDDKRLVAYFTEKDKHNIIELRHFIAKQLPDYMIPSAFVLLKALPLTPNGKIDRKALPKPEGLQRDIQSSYIAPQSGLEQNIVKIWQELLQVKEIGIEDTFFDLGGHSLLIVQLQERLKQALNQSIPVTVLFQYPTIKTLVQYLDTKPKTTAKSSRASKQQAAILRRKARR